MTVKIVLKISTITPPTANLYYFTIAEERFQLLFAYFSRFSPLSYAGSLLRERIPVFRFLTEAFLDAEKLIVFRIPLRPARCSGFDLAGACRDGKVCQKSSSVSPDRWEMTARYPCSLRHLHRIQRLRERSDLVYLDQDGVRATLLDTFLQELYVCNE